MAVRHKWIGGITMAEWRYRVIRYAPDMARGERINIGVCLFDGSRYHFRFLDPLTRVRLLDPHVSETLIADFRADVEAHATDPTYLEQRIGAFDPTFAFSDGRTVLNGQPLDEILEDLYRRLVYLPVPRREPLVPRVQARRERVAYEFLKRLEIPPERILRRVNPEKEKHADLFGLREPFAGEMPAVTACIPNGRSLILVEPLLIPKLTPKQVYDVGRKFLAYEDNIGPRTDKKLERATIYLGLNGNGGGGGSLLRLSKLFSEKYSEVVCDETDPKSVSVFRNWLWRILQETPLFTR
jgi:hypothetical protein